MFFLGTKGGGALEHLGVCVNFCWTADWLIELSNEFLSSLIFGFCVDTSGGGDPGTELKWNDGVFPEFTESCFPNNDGDLMPFPASNSALIISCATFSRFMYCFLYSLETLAGIGKLTFIASDLIKSLLAFSLSKLCIELFNGLEILTSRNSSLSSTLLLLSLTSLLSNFFSLAIFLSVLSQIF